MLVPKLQTFFKATCITFYQLLHSLGIKPMTLVLLLHCLSSRNTVGIALGLESKLGYFLQDQL